MNKNCPEILELKNRVEAQVKRKIKTPNDFIFLSAVIWERTHETISPTTLKRLWGYIDGADHARNSTLRILSTFLGTIPVAKIPPSSVQKMNSSSFL